MDYNIYRNGRLNQDDDLYFLSFFKNYSEEKRGLKYIYDLEDPKLLELRKIIPDEILSDRKNDFRTAVKLMCFVNNNLNFSSNAVAIRPFHAENILQKTHEEKIGSNCWMHAVVLQELLLAAGYKARMIRCMPMDLRFEDCHCVTEVYCESYKKWIILDPSMCTYYTDKKKIPIGLKEFRELILSGQRYIPAMIPAKMAVNLTWYWIKNLFRFERYQSVAFYMEDLNRDKTVFGLIPEGYVINDKVVWYGENKINYIYTHNQEEFWESGSC